MKRLIKSIVIKKYNISLVLLILQILEKVKKIILNFKIKQNNDSKIFKKFCKYVKRKLSSNNFKSQKKILMDCCNIPTYIIANLILTSKLKKLMKANIYTFDILPRDQNMEKIMSEFNSKHLEINLNSNQKKKLSTFFKKFFLKLKNKKDLYNLKINDIKIGVDIYETILKNRNPTVIFGTIEMYLYLYRALKYYIFFYNLFKNKEIIALCLSDNIFINTGLVTKLAYKFSVPVFHANEREINRTEKNFQLHNRFKRYKLYFKNLSKPERKKAILNSKKLINYRLSGKTKVKMFYQEKSAFTNKIISRQLKNTKKTKIIITTHCFYDNPSAYGGLLFKDFYEWLIFVGQQTNKLDYEFYIKPHRDYLPGTLETLKKIESEFSQFNLIDSETSFHQLKNEGAKIILTGYGSVGHELPLLGFLVINAGYNPHQNYSFCIHPKNLKDYKRILKNLEKFKKPTKINDIYKFFYVHYTLNHDDKFLFDSTEKYMKSVNYKLKSLDCYNYFLKDSKSILKRYSNKIEESLKSNRCFSMEKNLNNSLQQKLKKTNLSSLYK